MKFLKNIFFFILIFCALSIQCTAADFMPVYTNSINHYGIGAVKITNYAVIYEKPDLNSKVLQKIYWNNIGNLLFENKEDTEKPSDTFIAYLPKENTVFLSADDEDEEWVKVCYNQKKGLFGWIKKEGEKSSAKFYSYSDLFLEYGKKYGIYTYRNLPNENKELFSGPSKDARKIDSFKYVKYISPWLFQGNFALIKATTYDYQTKTGWFRWRNDDGTLNCFVNFK